ncbi:axonemal dynein light chain domain-containing protein 1-like, partial [Carlito syrichta]|uniref:Axonemal dynein light chain domain-containing protein 1-like n=1 Tax=Carlito syrichta TaxID=1868482 RepID=A0A3Q0DPY8_CARSF
EAIKEFIEPEVDKPSTEDEEESNEDKKLQEENEEAEEQPSTSIEKKKLIRFIGEDENVHSKPLFEADVLTSWKESANQGTLAQKYLEAMTIIEHMQDKLMELENRARQAEEKFEDVNEKLHYTLIRNKDLENELEEIAMASRKKEGTTQGECSQQ